MKKIAVIGKGTAGAQSVIHFLRHMPDCEIAWHFDPNISPRDPSFLASNWASWTSNLTLLLVSESIFDIVIFIKNIDLNSVPMAALLNTCT